MRGVWESSRRRHTRYIGDWSSDVCSSDLAITAGMLLRYNGMLVGNFELFATRTEQIEAEHKAIETLRDYWMTRVELERAVGGNLRTRKPARSEERRVGKESR